MSKIHIYNETKGLEVTDLTETDTVVGEIWKTDAAESESQSGHD